MVDKRRMPIWYHWVVLGEVGGMPRENQMTKTGGGVMTGAGTGETMTGIEDEVMKEVGEEEVGMLRRTGAGVEEMMTVRCADEMTIAEEEGEMMKGESVGEMMIEDMTTDGEDMAREMKEIDMRSAGGGIEMKIEEGGQIEMGTIEERKTRTAEAPKIEIAEVQVRGMIEVREKEILKRGAETEIMREKGKAPVRSTKEEKGQQKEA